MTAVSLNSIRQALGAAAVSVTALLASANLGHAQELRADAQELGATITARRPSTLVTPDYGRDHVFTQDECRQIRVATTLVFNRVSASNLSLEFRQGMINFIIPNGQTSTCTGSREISWRTQTDAATFNTIRGLLLTPAPNYLSLERAGVVLAPTPVASLNLR
jgi:hypothetical protein